MWLQIARFKSQRGAISGGIGGVESSDGDGDCYIVLEKDGDHDVVLEK